MNAVTSVNAAINPIARIKIKSRLIGFIKISGRKYLERDFIKQLLDGAKI